MLGDTVTIVYDGGNVVLTKINQDNYQSEYYFRDSEHLFRMRVRHSQSTPKGGVTKDRHNVEITRTVFALGEVDEYDEKVYLVVECIPAQANILLGAALAAWLTVTSNANLIKVVNWES